MLTWIRNRQCNGERDSSELLGSRWIWGAHIGCASIHVINASLPLGHNPSPDILFKFQQIRDLAKLSNTHRNFFKAISAAVLCSSGTLENCLTTSVSSFHMCSFRVGTVSATGGEATGSGRFFLLWPGIREKDKSEQSCDDGSFSICGNAPSGGTFLAPRPITASASVDCNTHNGQPANFDENQNPYKLLNELCCYVNQLRLSWLSCIMAYRLPYITSASSACAASQIFSPCLSSSSSWW